MSSVIGRLRELGDRGRRAAAALPLEPDTRAQVLEALKQPTLTVRVPLTDARVAVAASARVVADLAWEWTQVTLDPHDWHGELTPATALLLVEVTGARPEVGEVGTGQPAGGAGQTTVAGWPATAPVPAELAAVARERGIPSAAWVTGPCPQRARDALREVFDDVLVGAPATQVRAQSPAHDPATERPGDVLVLNAHTPARGDSDLAAADAGIVQALERSGMAVDAWTSEEIAHLPPATALAAQYRVLLDLTGSARETVAPLLDAIATRTAVVSTSERVQSLPETLRKHVASAEPVDLRRHAGVLVAQPELRDRTVHEAHRALLQGHTVRDRARSFLESAGVPLPADKRGVSVVVPTNRPHQLDNALANAARQARVDTELVLLAHGIDVDVAELAAQGRDLGLEHVTVVPVPSDRTLGAVLNLGLEAASGAYVAKMDDDNYYGPQFLADLVDAFGTTSAGITGKWAHYVWLRSTGAVVLRFEKYENSYHRLVQGGSIVVEREIAQDIRFSDIPRAVDSDFLNRAMAAGVQTWSGDRFNFISIRGTDRHSHTWQLDDLVFLSGAGRVVTYGDPTDLVTV